MFFLDSVKANPVAKALLGAFGGVTGIVAALLSVRSKFAKTLGPKGSSQLPLSIAAVIFFVLFSVVISWALLFFGSQPWAKEAASRLLGKTEYQGQLFGVFFLTAVTLLFGLVMGFFINVNKFSLHATYRSRLIRAFLGASRIRETRKPHLFTGFDPDDNIAMRDLPPGKPFHVINAALNLIKGEELAWQERKAESFTMSRLHSGSWHRRLPALHRIWRWHHPRNGTYNFRRRGQSEHGLPQFADRWFPNDAVQFAPRLVARQPRPAR